MSTAIDEMLRGDPSFLWQEKYTYIYAQKYTHEFSKSWKHIIHHLIPWESALAEEENRLEFFENPRAQALPRPSEQDPFSLSRMFSSFRTMSGLISLQLAGTDLVS